MNTESDKQALTERYIEALKTVNEWLADVDNIYLVDEMLIEKLEEIEKRLPAMLKQARKALADEEAAER